MNHVASTTANSRHATPFGRRMRQERVEKRAADERQRKGSRSGTPTKCERDEHERDADGHHRASDRDTTQARDPVLQYVQRTETE
jgi:hypothetical protein